MRSIFLRLLAIFLSCLLLAGCASQGAVSIIDAQINAAGELILYYSDGSRDFLGVVVGQDGKDGSDGSSNTSSIVSDISAATTIGLRSSVSIFCTHYTQSNRGSSQPYYSAGSGVIYQLDKAQGDAFIITNYHVVYDSNSRTTNGIAEEISIYLYGSEITGSEITATYVGGSMNYDIAILRVEDSEVLKNSQAAAVTVANSDNVRVGSTAIAIGNPEGMGISASSGVISVDSEYITMTAPDNITSVDFRVMRIDTAVNSGNSGGGLFDEQGRLIGIVNAKTIHDSVENIGYALPSSTVIAVADNIIHYCFGTACENVRRPIMGITVVTDASSAIYDEEQGTVSIRENIRVLEVSPGQIGSVFEVDDILVSIALHGVTYPITRQHHVIDRMLTARAGDVAKFQILRDGQEMTLEITVTENCLTDY